MSDVLVIEASVAIKWLIAEELSDKADTLLADAQQRRMRLVAPPLLFSEVTNGIYQRLRRRDIAISQAQRALIWFYDLPIAPARIADLHPRSFEFARRHSLKSVYDAEYAIVALETRSPLWTADRAFFEAIPEELRRWMRWIGDVPEPGVPFRP